MWRDCVSVDAMCAYAGCVGVECVWVCIGQASVEQQGVGEPYDTRALGGKMGGILHGSASALETCASCLSVSAGRETQHERGRSLR